MTGLRWRALVPETSKEFDTPGAELSRALLNGSRFCVYTVRCTDADGMPDVLFRLRDAETISDSEVKEGVRPRVVCESSLLDDVLAFASGAM